MDSFCINRGTLLDNPKVVSLEGPDQHSVHCLVDIASCYTSPFEMLVSPYAEDQKVLHSRGWRLNDAGREAMIALGRSVGHMESCSTCESTGELEKGFRAAVMARVISLNLEDELLVPEIEIIEGPVHTLNSESNVCSEKFNMTDILKILDDTEKNLLFTTKTDASFRRKRLAHGSMMLIGWGLLLPSGVIIARFFKHRPAGLWFKIHKICQPIGLLFALTGWIIALVNFDVFMDKDTRFIHGLVGSLVMLVGLLQPLNAFFRPHVPEGGGEKTTIRKIWEHYHRGAGWTAVFLSVIVIILGTTMLPAPDDQSAFQIAYAIGCIGPLMGFLIFIKVDKGKYTQAKTEEEPEAKGDDDEAPAKAQEAAEQDDDN